MKLNPINMPHCGMTSVNRITLATLDILLRTNSVGVSRAQAACSSKGAEGTLVSSQPSAEHEL